MKGIEVEGNKYVISIESGKNYLSTGEVLLAFKRIGDNSRTAIGITKFDLDTLIEAIIKYRKTEALENKSEVVKL